MVANQAFKPFAPVIRDAQKELSQLSLYQRVYQTLRLKGFNELSSPLDLRHMIGRASATFSSHWMMKNWKYRSS